MHANRVEDEALQRWTFPEEDRQLYTTQPWQGGYRWFRSPNVVPIEQWRRRKPTPIDPGSQGRKFTHD
jgi:hypothetical protein